ncbi:19275_t:CDS:2 [Dentiscutata erythropus]|uniref:Multiple inositol polyphosphate phosphatase 1 n=1 Tax=Dentiscutata erythropus TaxID=1348616 RepID=A0A9N9A137_9GLOM|nr:19275_t:CDS:2 [Dentiscutata erythropus]
MYVAWQTMALCKNPSDDAYSKLYNHDSQDLINKRYFRIEPAATAFTLDVEPISYPDKCELKQLYLLTRHGSRLPDEDEILMYDELKKIFADVSVAKEWYKNSFTMERNFQLVHRGELEPYYDGKQCALRYEKFWDTIKKETGRFDPNVVNFQGCSFSRCGESSMSFSEGLFDGYGIVGPCKNQPVYITSTPVRQDYVLEPYQDCLLLNTTVYTNNPIYNEQNYTYGNMTLAPIAERMSKDYGINPPLNPYLVPYIYHYCEFSVLTFNRTDTWCSLLSELDIKKLRSVMQADLKNGHAYGMLMVLTTLGVHRNPTLTANFTVEQMTEIKYTQAKTIFCTIGT